jgi:hypothetical protein
LVATARVRAHSSRFSRRLRNRRRASRTYTGGWRRLQQAYECPTYAEARTALGQLRQELRGLNVSAVASLDEGLEETLTLHRLGLFPTLGVSLKTTNCLESLNAQLGQLTDKVDHWRTADRNTAGWPVRWSSSSRACGESKATPICRCCARPCRLRSGGLRSRRESPWHEHDIEAASEFQLELGLTVVPEGE